MQKNINWMQIIKPSCSCYNSEGNKLAFFLLNFNYIPSKINFHGTYKIKHKTAKHTNNNSIYYIGDNKIVCVNFNADTFRGNKISRPFAANLSAVCK